MTCLGFSQGALCQLLRSAQQALPTRGTSGVKTGLPVQANAPRRTVRNSTQQISFNLPTSCIFRGSHPTRHRTCRTFAIVPRSPTLYGRQRAAQRRHRRKTLRLDAVESKLMGNYSPDRSRGR